MPRIRPGGATPAQMSTTYARKADTRPVLAQSVPATSHPDWYSTGLSNGTITSANFRCSHYITRGVHSIRVVFAHSSGVEGGNAAHVPTNDVTYRCALEMADGTIVPFFFQGKRDGVLSPSGILVSDALPVDLSASSSTRVYTRTFVTVPASGKFPQGRARNFADGEGGDTATNATDQTLSGTIATSSVFLAGPMMLTGTPTDGSAQPVVALMGDSITWGQGDVETVANYPNGTGYASRAFVPLGVPFFKIAAQGELASNYGAVTGRQTRSQVLRAATHAICGYGRNDISAGASATTVEARLIAVWRHAAMLGAKVWQTTVTPKTTSTDSWATVGNQTTASAPQETERVALNTWLRDGAPLNGTTFAAVATGDASGTTIRAGATGHPLRGVLDTTDTVESARNSGLWQANFTADGLHPTKVGHVAMAVPVTAAYNAGAFAV